MQRVMGIDPGLHLTGFAAVDLAPGALEPALAEAGVIRLPARQPLETRLAQLHEELGRLLDDLRPQSVAVEKLYTHYQHPRTAVLMAHARGVILLCLRQRGLAVAHLSATEVKKAVTGFGHASKQQVQRAVQAQCRLRQTPSPPDVADAIALALTCARRLALARL